MDKQRTRAAALVATVILAAGASMQLCPARAGVGTGEEPPHVVLNGTVSIDFDDLVLETLGWGFAAHGPREDVFAWDRVTFAIQPSSTLYAEATTSVPGAEIGGTALTRGTLMFTGHGDRVVVGNLAVTVSDDATWTVASTLGEPEDHHVVFELPSVMVDYSAANRDLRVIGELAITESLAEMLRQPQATGTVVGVLMIEASSPPDRIASDLQQADQVELGSPGAAASGEERGVAWTEGPDVVVGFLQSTTRFGRVGDITAYAVGTTSCNYGDERVKWIQDTNEHPVISQSMFRLKDGRMEHIGMSWVKHGFYALSMDACDLWPGDNCGDPTNGTELGVGCSDPYSASLNGVQSNMSLRSDVNAYTGYFPYPWTAPGYSNVIHRRLQVHDVDLDTELNEGALYFVQGHYVTADDAAAGNHFNNASYRPVTVTFTPPDIYNLYVIGETQREQPAIRAWQDTDPTVTETDVVVPNEGLFIVASQATDLGGGMWHYEYAVQNLNSDRSARLFSVPLPPHAVVENIGYHDVDYHSGEPYDQSGWQPTLADNSLSWSTYTFDVLEDANALRFGSLYNFRFDADVSPALLAVTIGLFKPGNTGDPSSVTAEAMGPVPVIEKPVAENELGEPPCEDDEDCMDTSACIDGVCYVPKNKYISFQPRNAGQQVALEVTLTSSVLFPSMVGSSWWVQPYGSPDPPDVFRLGCSPHFQNWSQAPSVIHVTDVHITPGATYDIRAIDLRGMRESSAPLPLPTVDHWGDCVGVHMGGGIWSPPNEYVNIDDVLASVDAFQGSAHGPNLRRIDVDGDPPDAVATIGDVLAFVLAFSGNGYSYAGPVPCP